MPRRAPARWTSCRSATPTSASTRRPTPTRSGNVARGHRQDQRAADAAGLRLHTGDITHLSKADEFDTADQMLKALNVPIFYTPGEHDTLDEGNGKLFLDRYGKGTWGTGWRSFDAAGVHFLGLVNTVGPQQGRPGPARRRADRLDREGRRAPGVLDADRGLRPHAAVRRLRPLGLGHRRRAGRAGTAAPLRLGDGAERPHPPGDHQDRGNLTFHTARSTAYPAGGGGHARGLGLAR